VYHNLSGGEIGNNPTVTNGRRHSSGSVSCIRAPFFPMPIAGLQPVRSGADAGAKLKWFVLIINRTSRKFIFRMSRNDEPLPITATHHPFVRACITKDATREI